MSDNGQNEPNKEVFTKVCTFCDWQGGDVADFPFEKGSLPVCQTCLIVAQMGINKLGSAHPGMLVPLIRSCVAQALSGMLSTFLDSMIKVMSACASEGMSIAEKSAVIQAAADSLKNNNN